MFDFINQNSSILASFLSFPSTIMKEILLKNKIKRSHIYILSIAMFEITYATFSKFVF
jgi:hypothetical protein